MYIYIYIYIYIYSFLGEISPANSILRDDRISCFCEKLQCFIKQGSH